MNHIQINEEAEASECPICGSGQRGDHDDRIHLAAHCCLWKHFPHHERVRIAERVERGMSWDQAINGDA